MRRVSAGHTPQVILPVPSCPESAVPTSPKPKPRAKKRRRQRDQERRTRPSFDSQMLTKELTGYKLRLAPGPRQRTLARGPGLRFAKVRLPCLELGLYPATFAPGVAQVLRPQTCSWSSSSAEHRPAGVHVGAMRDALLTSSTSRVVTGFVSSAVAIRSRRLQWPQCCATASKHLFVLCVRCVSSACWRTARRFARQRSSGA